MLPVLIIYSNGIFISGLNGKDYSGPFLKYIENKAAVALVKENKSIKSVYLYAGFNKVKRTK